MVYSNSNMGHYNGAVYANAGKKKRIVNRYMPATTRPSVLGNGGHHFGVSTVTFDTVEDLMWTGNQRGYVTSYDGFDLQTCTGSFRVHPTQEIRQINPVNDGILCLTRKTLRYQIRDHDIPLFTHKSKNIIDMQCMLQYDQRLLMGGYQEKIVDFDLTRSEEVGSMYFDVNGCTIMKKHHKLICAGNVFGKIDLRDQSTLSIEHTIKPYGRSLNDFDVQGNYLVTCGFNNSPRGLLAHPYIIVYDLRQMRALIPVPTMVAPYLLKFMPSYSSRLAVVSPLGQMQLLDTIHAEVQSPVACLYQVATGGATVTSFDVSPTSKNLAFTDVAGLLHLTSIADNPQFDTFSSKRLKMNSMISKTGKNLETIGSGFNRPAFRQNQIPYNLDQRRGVVPKFPGETILKTESGNISEIPDKYVKKEHNFTNFSGLDANLPNSYCNPMLQVSLSNIILLYNPVGFLFRNLDESRGSPCQTANLLRAFKSVPEAATLGLLQNDFQAGASRKTSLLTLIQTWNRFILHKMHYEILESKECQLEEEDETEISRLFGAEQVAIYRCLKCARQISRESTVLLSDLIYPELKNEEIEFTTILARSLNLEKKKHSWCDHCQKFNPTLEKRSTTKLPQVLSLNCGLESSQGRDFWQAQMDIAAQKVMSSKNPSRLQPTSIEMCRYGKNCQRTDCKFGHTGKNQDPVSQQSLKNLYSSHSWVPHSIEISLDDYGELSIEKLDGNNIKMDNDSLLKNEKKIDKLQYTLTAVICSIEDQKNVEKNHLISSIRVGPNYHERSNGSAVAQWYIFNDNNITAVEPQEAVWFDLNWKIPCVLYYTALSSQKTAEEPFVSPLTHDVFSNDKCVARNPTRDVTFTKLTSDEMLKKGELVGLDSEFVALTEKETKLGDDGKMTTIKPSHMAAARITCIRGQGPLKGTPFIDDYIHTQEPVADYLTKFSGILPGDLDANFSSKHLTTLKSTYQKLRYLVDNGVVFVGHGLENDFKVINLVVPAEQIIDTVILFHLPNRRMVSLRFLTWHFFGKKIQSETHDSAEDARAALELYHKYLELQKNDTLDKALIELYQVGNNLQWKVPEN
ncbi:PAN2-PAN3 deadenylation complex catalytic subunit PAN2-like [Aphidius gifuensis]|uniref:PAN2-PAN3 deadenylation complex catalytic subunit PAN2-like n=1 Tax=Aphidius gifuensis TaxID=684658 RepID=UPI001CDC40DC|nr:PAN2-PAN3 deadenylation complex catalytic subunit PAN2-like [Aphidius gifuensis]